MLHCSSGSTQALRAQSSETNTTHSRREKATNLAAGRVTVTPDPKAETAGAAGGSLWEWPLGPDSYGEAAACRLPLPPPYSRALHSTFIMAVLLSRQCAP